EGRLCVARRVAVGRPVAGRVGGEDLVGQDQGAVGGVAELELGVGQDQADAGRVFGGPSVDQQGGVPKPFGDVPADVGHHVVERDVLVVGAQFPLGGRR